jgi:hypothetical protein
MQKKEDLRYQNEFGKFSHFQEGPEFDQYVLKQNDDNFRSKIKIHYNLKTFEVMFFVVADGSQGNTKQIPVLLCLF